MDLVKDITDYLDLIDKNIQFVQILGRGSHGLVIHIYNTFSNLNCAMKIDFSKQCTGDPMNKDDFDSKKEFEFGKIMEVIGVGVGVYNYGCVADKFNYPFINMELFEGDCFDVLMYAVQNSNQQLFAYIFKECIYLIKLMIYHNKCFTDVKLNNFVINLGQSHIPIMKMIDFDDKFLLESHPETKKLLPSLLILQIFFMNLSYVYNKANHYLETYMKIFNKYLIKYFNRYDRFNDYIQNTPLIEDRLSWYTVQCVMDFIDKTYFNEIQLRDIFEYNNIAAKIAACVFSLYKQKHIDSPFNFGKLKAKTRTPILHVRQIDTKLQSLIKSKRKKHNRSIKKRMNYIDKHKGTHKGTFLGLPPLGSDAQFDTEAVCRLVKNVPIFVPEPNPTAPTLYKTTEELTAAWSGTENTTKHVIDAPRRRINSERRRIDAPQSRIIKKQSKNSSKSH